MKVEKVYISAIGKLYQEVQENSQLDKIVTDLYSALEFEIKTGERLPINIKAMDVLGKLDKELDYVIDSLYSLGCKGRFSFDTTNHFIEFWLEDLIWTSLVTKTTLLSKILI